MLQYYMWFLYFCLQSIKEFLPSCFIPLGTSFKKNNKPSPLPKTKKPTTKNDQKTSNQNPTKKNPKHLYTISPLIHHFVDLGILLAYLFCSSPRFLTVSFIMVLRYLKQTVVNDRKTQHTLVLSTFSVPFSY